MKLRKKLSYLIGSLVVLYLFNTALTMTYYNPHVAVRAYSWLAARHVADPILWIIERSKGETEELYPLISISRLEKNLYWGPRAAVIGTVIDTEKIVDGDWHINIKDAEGMVLVTEMAPEYPLPVPAVGARVKIWGVTRYDLDHRWWELHPIFGWEEIKK